MKYKKYIKRFFIGLIAFILLLAISIFVLISFYKKELATILTNNLKDNYGLTLKVEDINVSVFSNWPKGSVELKNTYLANELFPNKPILQAGSIVLSLDIVRLLKKEFIIESVLIKDAKIELIKNKDGNDNFLIRSNNAENIRQKIKFEINKVTIINTKFNYTEVDRGQKIDFLFIENRIKIKNEQDGIEANFFGDVKVGELLFNSKKGAFLKNKNARLNLYVSVFTKSKTVFIHPPSSATIDNHPFLINSFIELNEKKKLMLSIESKNVNYEKTVVLLNTNLQKNLQDIKIKGDLDAKILVIAKLGIKQDPIIIAHIAAKNNDVTIGHSKIPYSGLSFNGMIVSMDPSREKGNSEKAKVIFNDIKGNLYDFPFTASVTIANFDEPKIDINGNLFITASKINFKPGEEFILKGSCVAKLQYSGPTNKMNKQEFLDPPMKLNAGLFFNNLSYQEKDKPYVYTVEGNANLLNKDLQFENLFLKTDAGNVILKGNVKNFANYALGYSDVFKATLDARSESFNLNPYLLTQTKKTETVNDANKKAAKKAIKKQQSNFEFNVTLNAKKLQIRNVKATNANINLSYKNKLLDVRSVNMNTCGGKLTASGTVYDLTKIAANVKIEDMDVNSVFNEFENFGQKAVVSENLQGNIFIDAKFKTELDEKMEVIGNTMDSEIKIKLKDGHLLNFEPIQKISDYIFRNRDFKDISFTEINETCKIKGFEMQIDEMEIASSVLNLFVSGKYNFTDNSNINILIPWSNLKRRGKNYIPISSGQTAENSKGLKLNYSGPPKKLKLSLGYK